MTMESRRTAPMDQSVLSQIWQCPGCRTDLMRIEGDKLWCVCCDRTYHKENDIWDLLGDTSVLVDRFIRTYDELRYAEGWGSDRSEYYRNLPYKDITGRHQDIWKIRSKNWELFVRLVLDPMERNKNRPLNILDIGAGNGWASCRLTERGHRVCAVDVRSNARDGLGACDHYPVSFTRVLADMDQLPLKDGIADMVIYNASLHYSADYNKTLEEGLRVLACDGRLAVLDTPWYSSEQEGQRMLNENRDRYSHEYPWALPVPSFRGFITKKIMGDINTALAVKESVYGRRQSVTKWINKVWRRIRRLREPASFPVLVMRRSTSYPLPEDRKEAVIRKIPIIRSAYCRYLKLYNAFVRQYRYNREHFEKINGRQFLVLPHVFPPLLMRSGAWLAKVLIWSPKVIPLGGRILDLGTGSGVLALTASWFASEVIGIDNNPDAILCARENAVRLHRANVRFVQGDLFDPVQDEKFDCILCNPPFFKGNPTDHLDGAWRSESFMKRLAGQLRDHLNPGGYALMVLSDHGESEWLLGRLWKSGYGIQAVAHHDYVNEVLMLYKINRERS